MATTVALAAAFVAEHYGAPIMLIALLMGLSFKFLTEADSTCHAGIDFASKRLMRIGVALLGLGISIDQIKSAGMEVLLLTFGGVLFTIISGLILSRFVGRGNRFGILLGGTVAICGASAALAISAVLPKSDTLERDTLFAVIAATVLSTIAMIVYPIIALNLGLSDTAAGVFFGATIHDVAQVVGAGYSISETAGETATFTKLMRVSLLLPIVVIISFSIPVAERPNCLKAGE